MSRRAVFVVFAAFSLVRALLVPAFELMPQSAYYFTYAEHPALSYYDHPPMIGWLLWIGTALFGKSVLAVRGTVFVTTLATQLAVFALGKRLLGEEAAGRALVFLTTGGVALLLSFVATPDVPLLLFWALALLALERALFRDEEGSGSWLPWLDWLYWLGAGAAMGLAFLSKYTGVFLQGGLVLFLLASPGHRRILRTPKPWIALAVAQLVSLPVWIWNLRHDFASFAFQFGGRAAESRFDPDDALGFLASQAAVLLPVGFGLFVWVAGQRTVQAVRRRGAIDPRELFLLSFALPLFATCIALSTLTWVKVNWPMPAYLSGLLLVAPAVGRRATAWQAGLGGALLLAAAVQLAAYPVRVGSNDTWWGWRELAAEAEALHARHPDRFLFSGDNYKTTAELRFYTDLPVYGMNVIGWNALQYDYIGEDLSELVGRDALLIQEEERLRPSERTERYLLRTRLYFEEVEEMEPIELRHRGEVTRLFRVFDCRGYLGPDLPIPWELYGPER